MHWCDGQGEGVGSGGDAGATIANQPPSQTNPSDPLASTRANGRKTRGRRMREKRAMAANTRGGVKPAGEAVPYAANDATAACWFDFLGVCGRRCVGGSMHAPGSRRLPDRPANNPPQKPTSKGDAKSRVCMPTRYGMAAPSRPSSRRLASSTAASWADSQAMSLSTRTPDSSWVVRRTRVSVCANIARRRRVIFFTKIPLAGVAETSTATPRGCVCLCCGRGEGANTCFL